MNGAKQDFDLAAEMKKLANRVKESGDSKKSGKSESIKQKQGAPFTDKGRNFFPGYYMENDYDGYGTSKIRITDKNGKTVFSYTNSTYKEGEASVSETTRYDKNGKETGTTKTYYYDKGARVVRSYMKNGKVIMTEKITKNNDGTWEKHYYYPDGTYISDEKEIEKLKNSVEPQDKDYKKYKKEQEEYLKSISDKAEASK
ncbi:MAG: hypothetical protein ACI37Q_06175 [Candidatus Gastranaerophilaceae bacterium]